MSPKRAQPQDIIDLTLDDDEDPPPSVQISDDDEAEDLKMAIALSLQDHVAQSATRNRTSSAIGRRSPTPALENKTSSQPETTASVSAITAKPSVLGFLNLDRKQMEMERLARLKRKRSDSQSDNTSSPARASKPLIDSSSQDSVKKEEVSGRSPQRKVAFNIKAPAIDNQSRQHREEWLQYPAGKVLLTTTNPLRLRSPGNVSLPQLLKPTQPGVQLKAALLSTFVVDFDWLFPHFDTKAVSFVLALHAANDQHKFGLEHDFGNIGNVKLIFPPVHGAIRCMHSKLMLLFYESESTTQDQILSRNRCRIVVPTANLVPYDWGVGNVMENAVFVIDLPEKKSSDLGENTSPESSTSTESKITFKNNLVTLLQSMQVPAAVWKKLDRYDFSATEKLGFVHSIGGSHSLRPSPMRAFFTSETPAQAQRTKVGNQPALLSATRTALLCLTDTIRSLGLTEPDRNLDNNPRMDYLTSSLGNLKTTFLASLRWAALGHPGSPHVPITGQTAPKSSASHKDAADQKTDLRVYFPSERIVHRSKGGAASAGTICFSSQRWDGKKEVFPKDRLRDCTGVREDGILMHSKILYVTFAQPQTLSQDNLTGSSAETSNQQHGHDEPQSFAGWAYVGSANCTESAWGAIVAESKSKLLRLNCSNWESGVVIPVPVSDRVRRELASGKKLHDLTLQEIFADVVPVPFKEPAENYQDGRRPWFFNG